MSAFQKVQSVLAALLVLSFVLPWLSVGDVLSLAGYEIGRLTGSVQGMAEGLTDRQLGSNTWFFYLFYAVPVLCVGVIALAFLRQDAAALSFMTGLYTLGLFVLWLGQLNVQLGQYLVWGAYVTIGLAIALMLVVVVLALDRFLFFVDQLSVWTGRTFAWCIIILTFAISYEVFVRYALRAPTAWAYDVGYMMYGALFLMAGAYTVSRDGHVRGDVVYRLWPPRVQAAIDLTLYILFYFPGVTALIYAGFRYARMSFLFRESSVFSPAGVPIYQLKALIPAAGVLLFLQGISEIVRCVRCIRDGQWPRRYHDVEEVESALLHYQEDHSVVDAERPTPQRGGRP